LFQSLEPEVPLPLLIPELDGCAIRSPVAGRGHSRIRLPKQLPTNPPHELELRY
jgi:hypothetical protein